MTESRVDRAAYWVADAYEQVLQRLFGRYYNRDLRMQIGLVLFFVLTAIAAVAWEPLVLALLFLLLALWSSYRREMRWSA